MPLKNTDQSYGWLAKTFHWVLALFIVTQLIVGNVMTDMENTPQKFETFQLHKSFGFLILALVIARICWRVMNTEPTHGELPAWQRCASTTVHYALYACMLAMPLSGWLMLSTGGHTASFFGLFDLPALAFPDAQLNKLMVETHETVAWILVSLLGVHIAAALLHHFYYKDNILKRMLP